MADEAPATAIDDADPSGRRRLSRDERRELILDAAEVRLCTRDAGSVTLEEVADQAGISRALLYNHFADRQALIDELRARLQRRLLVELRRAVLGVDDPIEALAAAVRVHLETARRNPYAYQLATSDGGGSRLLDAHASLLGGGAEGRLIAVGTTASVHSVVVAWADPELDDAVSLDRATELVTAFLAGAVHGVARAGVAVSPSWR